MNVLIACEFSAIVRDAFIKKGHNAWSCDLLPTEGRQGNHFQGDVIDAIEGRLHKFDAYDIRTGNRPIFIKWNLMIAHPPCTHLAVSGARWFKDKQKEQEEALNFVRQLMDAPIERICVENPVSIISSRIRKPDQIIQPWQFGHGETKTTCLWLKNLPKLKPTNIVEGRENKIHKMSPSPDRWKERSRTYQGIAEAMADQWGIL